MKLLSTILVTLFAALPFVARLLRLRTVTDATHLLVTPGAPSFRGALVRTSAILLLPSRTVTDATQDLLVTHGAPY